jgi:uncharacterized protein YgiM (DUF1202 family)
MSKNKTIVDVRVKDIEKWRYPSKHYVYVLEVTWSEGTKTIIYRRYSRFFEFQCKLLEKFPEEAGSKDPAQRMIPFLPGKKIFGRSHTRKVAMERKQPIDEYCRQLIRLPPKLSDSSFVIDFFEITEEDINPQKEKLEKKTSSTCDVISDPVLLERYVAVADYNQRESNQCNLRAGQVVEVVEKNQHGWWFVNCTDDFSEGWVPANFLEPYDKDTEEDSLNEVLEVAENHITTNSYEAQSPDEISFEKGVVVKVLEKKLDGWWRVSYKGSQGYVPAIFLEAYTQDVDETKLSATYSVFTMEDAVKETMSRQTRSKDDSDKPKTSHTHQRRGSDSGPSTSPSKSPAEATSRVVFAGAVAKNEPKRHKRSLSPPRTFSSASSLGKANKPTVSKHASVSEHLSSSVSGSKVSGQPRPQPPRPQRPPHPIKQSSHEAIYGTITAPPPRKNSIKKTKGKPKSGARPQLRPKPLPPALTTETETTSDQPDQHLYENIDDTTPPENNHDTTPTEYYRTVAEFSSQVGDGLSFPEGVVVELISQTSSGWWYVLLGDKEGWVPSSYLDKCDPPNAPPPVKTSLAPAKNLTSDHNNAISGSHSPTPPTRESTSPSNTTRGHLSSTFALQNKPKPPKPERYKKSTDGDAKPLSLKPYTPTKSASSTRDSSSSTCRDPLHPPVKESRTSKPVVAKKTPSSSDTTGVRRDPPSPSGKTQTRPPTIDKPKPYATSSTLSSGKAPPPKPRPRAATKAIDDDQSSGVSSELAAILAKRSVTSGSGSRPTPSGLKPSLQSSGPKPSHRVTNGSGNHPSPKPKPKSIHSQELAPPIPVSSAKPTPIPSRPPHSPKPRPTRPAAPIKKSDVQVNGSDSRRPPPRPPASPSDGSDSRRPPPRPPASPSAKADCWVTCESYTAQSQDCLSFEQGVVVDEVVEKAGDWWFVELRGEQGWVPSTYLERSTKSSKGSKPSRPLPPSKNYYFSLADFNGLPSGSIPLSEGERVEVMEECDDGWWRVSKTSGEEGWVPATYLEKQ